MPRKCSVWGCSTNYASSSNNEKVTVYGFPTSPSKRSQWTASLPNIVSNVTKNMGVCNLHWPANYEMHRPPRSPCLVPKHPPTIFQNVPRSVCRQVKPLKLRQTYHKISAESRTAISDAMEEVLDNIASFDILRSSISKKIEYLQIKFCINTIVLYDISDNTPPEVTYSITISSSMKVVAFNNHTPVYIRDLLGFAAKLSKWSQLKSIVDRTKNASINMTDELRHLVNVLNDLSEDDSIKFFSDQINLFTFQPEGRRYGSVVFNHAVSFLLSSRSCYRNLSDVLFLPHSKTIFKYLSRMSNAGTLEEGSNLITRVLNNEESDKNFMVIFDEIYVKASIRYRGSHLIGYSLDNPQQAARTILCIMLKSTKSSLSFVCRLLPVYILKPDFLHDALCSVIHNVHDNGGTIECLIGDNNSVNRVCYDKFRSRDKPLWNGTNPVTGKTLYLFIDSVHLFKSVRNNWITSVKKCLTVEINGEKIDGDWMDICNLYKQEANHIVRRTPLTYQSCYPSNLEKQKVSLMVNVFNEKVIAALRQDGKINTAMVLEIFTKCWHILNSKCKFSHVRLNDPDRAPFSQLEDERFVFLDNFSKAIAKMPNCKGTNRYCSLSAETKNALMQTIDGLSNYAKHQIANGEVNIMLGRFQSDVLEGEFGVYRQLNGGNFYISVEQVLSSYKLRTLKLFHKLQLMPSRAHITSACCTSELSDADLEIIDSIVTITDSISDHEEASILYVCGYVAKKYCSDPVTTSDIDASQDNEFVHLVSRGKLKIPSENLFQYARLLYLTFRHLQPCICAKKMFKAGKLLYETYHFPFEAADESIMTLINTFNKGLVTKYADQLNVGPELSGLTRRKRKLE